jgi:hypothetical protein
MAHLIVDAMDTAGEWSAFAPDGVKSSTELSLSAESEHIQYGTDRRSGKVVGSTSAQDHTLRRSLPGIDLTNFDDIRLWFRSSRVADGSPLRPFFLEVRLASAAVDLNDPVNTWHRYLPAPHPDTWDLVRLSLDDLSPQVRSSVNMIQLRCVDAEVSFTCYLDDVLAVREEMIGDLNAALLARLHQQVVVGRQQVPAAMYVHGASTTPGKPFISIMHHDVQLADARTTTVQARGDYTGAGFRLRPISVGYDLYYEIEAVADDWHQQTQILEFVLRSLAPRSHLIVNGIPIPIAWVAVPPFGTTGVRETDRPLLRFVALTRQEIGATEPATPPYRSVVVAVDLAAPAP